MRPITLCAELVHTQGAALYAFHAYLSLAAWAARLLPEARVSAVLSATTLLGSPPGGRPSQTGQTSVHSLFTHSSLSRLVESAGFELEQHDWRSPCWEKADVRLGHTLHVHEGHVPTAAELKALRAHDRLP
eukprot:4967631-Prymnesium_polylepis.1